MDQLQAPITPPDRSEHCCHCGNDYKGYDDCPFCSEEILFCSWCKRACESKESVVCVCDKYGFQGHEELAWCSLDCLDEAHPEVNFDERE